MPIVTCRVCLQNKQFAYIKVAPDYYVCLEDVGRILQRALELRLELFYDAMSKHHGEPFLKEKEYDDEYRGKEKDEP